MVIVATSEEALMELYTAYKTDEYGVLNQKYGYLRSFVQRVFTALRQVLVKVLGKRFGHLSDYDLADALKNTIQDNQKLARMIDALDKVDLADARKNDDFRLSLDENPHSAFARAVDNVVNGKAINPSSSLYVKMGMTPDVLKMVGLPNGKISIRESVIEKAMGERLGVPAGKYPHIHNVTADTLKALPKQLNNPVAVLKSAQTSSNPDGFVVLTELFETKTKTGKDEPLIVALDVKKSRKGVEIVNITSVYGKGKNWLKREFESNLLYVNKAKGQQFLNTVNLQLGLDFTSDADLSKQNIRTELDLEQYLTQQSFDKTAKRLGGQSVVRRSISALFSLYTLAAFSSLSPIASLAASLSRALLSAAASSVFRRPISACCFVYSAFIR